LTASQLSRWIAALRAGDRSEATIAGYVAHLKAALNWAVDIGLLSACPKIQKPKRAKAYKKAKGRAPTDDEFKAIIEAVPEVVGAARAASWHVLMEGLWLSGLRLGEALELWWDRQDKLRIQFVNGRAQLVILGELEKGNKDRLLPVAPEFSEFLQRTPA